MSNPTTFAFYGDSKENAQETVKAIQTSLIIGAVLSAIVGIILLAWTGAALFAVALVLGIYFVVRGIVRLMSGIFAPGLTAGGRTLSIILGILLILVGVFTLKNPGDSLALLGILIGLSWIIDGIATLVESPQAASRGFAIVAGLLGIIAGIVVLFVPLGSVAVLTMIAGLFLVVIAIAQIVGAIVLGSKAKKALS